MRITMIGLIAVWLIGAVACKKRSMNEIRNANKLPSTSDLTLETDIDKLKLERNALISELEAQKIEGARQIADLTLQRDELNTQKASVELDITRLQKELAASVTPEEKAQIQKKLDTASSDRDDLAKRLQLNADTIIDLLKKMETLSEDIRKANARIVELNQRIETLQNELTASRARTETTTTDTTVIKSADSVANSTQTPAPVVTTAPTPPADGAVPTPTPVATGVVSTIAWQFFRLNADTTRSCFEFGSTQAGASLLGLSCVTPPPVRQQFKTETFGSSFLIVDQRTLLCLRLDALAANAATARILLGACKRGGDMDELFSIVNADAETGEFQFKSVKTGNCLHIGDDKKVIQLPCATASNLRSTP